MMTTSTTGRIETLVARDGHSLEAWVARPPGRPRGGVVLLQEIFGLNSHVRHKADEYAAQGFLALAPGLFDRVERGLVLGYGDMQRGIACVGAITEDMLLADLQAAIDATAAGLAAAGAAGGPVSAIGWCWGGAVAYLAASKCSGLHRAACYYGTRIATFCERMTPAVPTIYHFGALDKSLPPEAIAKIRAHDPAGVFHVYEGADHAFTNHERPAYDASAAQLADRRTREFLG
jgi:carboxymethylenebutenolidase